MGDVCIWIVSKEGYLHSRCFEEVAIALQSGLRAHGIHAPIVTDPKDRNGVPIILGAQLLSHLPPIHLHPKSIIYNLEQVDVGSQWLDKNYIQLLKKYRVWDYSQRNIAALAQMGMKKVQHVQIGYAPELTCIPRVEEDIDVLFIGSLNQRRRDILNAIQARGVKVEVGFNVYGAERDAMLARAKIILNLHFYEAKVFEIVRVSYLLANCKCVISERGGDAALETPFENGLIFADAANIPQICVETLADTAKRRAIAENGLALFSRMPQARYLESVIPMLR